MEVGGGGVSCGVSCGAEVLAAAFGTFAARGFAVTVAKGVAFWFLAACSERCREGGEVGADMIESGRQEAGEKIG